MARKLEGNRAPTHTSWLTFVLCVKLSHAGWPVLARELARGKWARGTHALIQVFECVKNG